jgi:hypothetical protein
VVAGFSKSKTIGKVQRPESHRYSGGDFVALLPKNKAG